jgi:hypothetical protein
VIAAFKSIEAQVKISGSGLNCKQGKKTEAPTYCSDCKNKSRHDAHTKKAAIEPQREL